MFVQALTKYTDQLMQDALFKAIVSTVMSVLAAMTKNMAALCVLLALLLCCDFVLGFLEAWKAATLNRRKGDEGAVKIVAYVVAVFVVAAAEHSMRLAGFYIPFRDLFISFLCVNEALSCISHLAFFGVPFPSRLKEKLTLYRENLSEKKEKP